MFCKMKVQKFIKSTYKKVKTTQQKKEVYELREG